MMMGRFGYDLLYNTIVSILWFLITISVFFIKKG